MDHNVPRKSHIPSFMCRRKWLEITTHLSVTGSWWPWRKLPHTRVDPLIFQIFGQRSIIMNHQFHSVVTSCRLSTLRWWFKWMTGQTRLPLVKTGNALLHLNVAVYVQVCRLFCVVYMPLFGLVQARPWFRSSMWISSVAGISKILCSSEVASALMIKF